MAKRAAKKKVDSRGQVLLLPGPKLIEREKNIQDAIMMAVAASGVLLFRNNVGLATYKDSKVKYGLGKGSADLIGVVHPTGRFLALEVKRPRGGKVAPQQERWLKWVQMHGGVSGVVRSVAEALALVEQARRLP